jgi:LCP family protein required for cell wall assembly
LSTEVPPAPDGGGEHEYFRYERRGVNRTLIMGIGGFAVLSLYLWLLVATRVDGVLSPGNSLFPAFVDKGCLVGCQSDPDHAETPEQRINILVMGLDQRLDERDDQPYRTDSIVIFSIDPYSKTAGAFSIPRDTRIAVPYKGEDWTYTRINEVYEMGQYGVGGYPSKDYGKGGAQLAMDTIDYNFDIPIDYYVIINWDNFISIVDDLGGITIDVPEYVYDPLYSTCQFCGEYYPVEFDPGVQDMDGARALEYARLRKSDNDYKRIERQQLVMRAIATKATSLNLLDVGKALDMYGTYKDSIKTNVRDSQLPGLARLGGQVGLANVRLVSAAPATFPCPYSICGGAAELLWDRDEFERLKALVFSDQRVVNEGAKIKILNGTPTRGLAGKFAGQLSLQGLPAVDITSDEWADGPLWETTKIFDLTASKPETLDLIKGELSLTDLDVYTASDARLDHPELEEFLDDGADIIVVLGTDNKVRSPTYYYDSDYSGPGGGDYIAPEDTVTPEPTLEPVPEPTATAAPSVTETPAPTESPPPDPPTDPPAQGGPPAQGAGPQ